MSFAICRVQKMGKGSVKGIQIHDTRQQGLSHTNPDIDWERSKLNYDLHPAQNNNYNQAVKERIEQLKLKRAVRKDAVVMAQVLVTSDNAFFRGLSEAEQKRFFQDSYDFLANRYGAENVISATVHLDEQTPHLHFNFVPVTADGRLSAKAVLTRQALIEQQDMFISSVGSKYGLQRGVRSDERREHLDTADYKLKTALERTQQAEAQLEELKGKILTQKEINAINGKKTLTGGLKGVSYEEYLSLKKTAENTLKTKNRAKKLKDENETLKNTVNELQNELEEAKTLRIGREQLLKNQVKRDLEDKYKKYAYRSIPLNQTALEEITRGICCVSTQVESDNEIIIKCPVSEEALLDKAIQSYEQNHTNQHQQKKKQGQSL
mgnify:CR=1 FL=1|jgi:hypothetical protein